MPSVNRETNCSSHITRKDVLEDLGLSREDLIELKIKADLWRSLVDYIAPLNLTQKELAKLLDVHQPEVSYLLKGKLSRFSVGALIRFGARLNLGFEGKFTKPKRSRISAAVASTKSARNRKSVKLRLEAAAA
jgi:predicted XRE-type DNA-binding protein